MDRQDESVRDDLPAPLSIAAVAALTDGVRRRLYAYVRRARRAVSREEAARSVGISRKLAAFHLDKLVEVGLLRVQVDASAPRRVGRRPKVYEAVEDAVAVSIPARRPELLAGILVDGLLAGGPQAHEAVLETARRRGAELGAREREKARPGRLGAERALTLAATALRRYGFEPDRDESGRVHLRNCPFQPLAARAPALVCALNHAFLDGFLGGLQARSVTAVLVPTPGECCVRLETV